MNKTLRDEFAMAALPVLLGKWDVDDGYRERVADECYLLADAMLAARGPEAEPAAPVVETARKAREWWLWEHYTGEFIERAFESEKSCQDYAAFHSYRGRAVRFVEAGRE